MAPFKMKSVALLVLMCILSASADDGRIKPRRKRGPVCYKEFVESDISSSVIISGFIENFRGFSVGDAVLKDFVNVPARYKRLMEVKVKRTFRGNLQDDGTVYIMDDAESRKCPGYPRLRDTRIFLTTHVGFVDAVPLLRLDFAPLPVNLKNLRMVKAALSTGLSTPIAAASLVAVGEPRDSVEVKKDPCKGITCPFYGTCLPSEDTYTCACAESCDSVFKNGTICGTNAVDYDSTCHLRRESCLHQKEIDVKYYGPCDPCASSTCGPREKCVLGNGRVPLCSCDFSCPLADGFSDICASNGKTYGNVCKMEEESCRIGKELRILYKGPCSSGVNPCSSLTCDHGESCLVDDSGYPQCVCSSVCDPVLRPVCGTDGLSYENECELQKSACESKKDVVTAYDGFCDPASPCHGVDCFGGQCLVINSTSVCKCPVCDTEYDPICAEDKKTYRNLCELTRESCEKKEKIVLKHKGFCNQCEVKFCDFYSSCVQDDFGNPSCVCPECKEDPGLYSPVCGTDGVTYPSECHLKARSCEKQQHVVVASLGHCDLCSNVQCKHGAYCEDGICICPTDCPASYASDTVCGSDGRTYGSECALQRAACNKEKSINVLHRGPCISADTRAVATSACACHQLGSADKNCDKMTGKCKCKEGVTGLKCDRCLSGHWGLHRASEFGGCSACGCSQYGSVRNDCDQTSGRCVCKPGIRGHKCDLCEDGTFISKDGCGSLSFDIDEQMLASAPAAPILSKSTRHVISPHLDSWNPQFLGAAGNQLGWRPTPSTFGLYGLLGDPCITDSDCIGPHGACLHGLCACADGYAESEDRKSCISNMSQLDFELAYDTPCASSPCLGGGTCRNLGRESYICVCPPGRKGFDCESVVESEAWTTVAIPNSIIDSALEVPGFYFDGRATGIVRRISVVDHLSVEFEFRPDASDGILVYTQQREDGIGDYFSVSLVGGHIELRYELGSGAIVIRSSTNVKTGRWHRVTARRYRQDGVLQVNDDPEIYARSPGYLKSLDTNGQIIIGRLPGTMNSQLRENAGTGASFVGCMRKIKIEKRSLDLLKPGKMISAVGVKKCMCKTRECNLEQETEHGEFVHLDGKLAFKYLRKVVSRDQRWNHMSFSFQTLLHNGLILWIGDISQSKLKDEFISAALSGGKLEIRIKFGKRSEATVLRSRTVVSDGQWHEVIFERRKRRARLTLDGQKPVRKRLAKGTSHFNNTGKVFLGTIRSLSSELPSSYRSGFVGCLGELSFDRVRVDLQNPTGRTKPDMCNS